MKTRSIQTLLLAATLGLLVTACNNDSDQTVDITKPINVKLSLTTTGTNIPISRAAIGATEFDDDDALGLYIAHKTGANDESPILRYTHIFCICINKRGCLMLAMFYS